MKEKKKNQKLMIILSAVLTVAAIASALLWLFVFSADTPAKQFENVKSSDIESITGKLYLEGSTCEIKGEDIDEFIKLLRDADYKRSDRTDHYASHIEFTIKYNDGKEQTVIAIGPYSSDDTMFKGFVRVDDGDLYECDTKKLYELFLKNSNSKYKE